MATARKGTMVDERYRLDRKIGTGGMADVWLAEDTELDRNVAIKILHDRFAQDGEFVQRFQREAQSAAGLQHPNVVGVFDRGEFADTYFIAMEYVDGPSLKDLVKGGMGTKDAIDFTRQILNAARFAHRKGIIHRDLKPQNVLIDDEGRARVADFGIARGGENSDITATGSVMGTAQYLSPEQAQGKPTTPSSDIYSIGVILYEALTGRVPVRGGQRRRRRPQAGLRDAEASQRDQSEHPAGSRRRGHAGARQGSRGALQGRRCLPEGARRRREGPRCPAAAGHSGLRRGVAGGRDRSSRRRGRGIRGARPGSAASLAVGGAGPAGLRRGRLWSPTR